MDKEQNDTTYTLRSVQYKLLVVACVRVPHAELAVQQHSVTATPSEP